MRFSLRVGACCVVQVEAMKMIMALKASETGKISHEMSPGSIIAAGDLLASLQLAVRQSAGLCAHGVFHV